MKIEKRTEKLKDVRAQEKVAGVIYGKNIKSQPIQVDYKEFVKAYHEFGQSMTFKAKLGSRNHTVYFKDIQIDAINPNNFVHFDLQKVSASDTITADIPIYIVGKEVVEKKGLIVQQILDSVETEFPVSEGISNFELDVSALEGNDTLSVGDLECPEGFIIHQDKDALVINVTYPSYDEEEEETDEEEEVEVEAIKQKDEDEE